jgi:hypothetical protein
MNFYKAILVIGIFVLLTNCKKATTSLPPVVSQNPTSYVLIAEVWSGPITNGESFFFSYDSSHLLTDYMRIQWGGAYTIIGNDTTIGSGFSDTTTYHLEYNNGRVWRQYSKDGNSQSYSEYAYNNRGQLVKATDYNFNGQPDGYGYQYIYNSLGQLTDMLEGSYPYNFHYTFAYNVDGNLAIEVDSTLYTNGPLIYTSEYSNYDSRVNFVKAINGYPTTFATDNNFGTGASISPNNFGRLRYSTSQSAGGVGQTNDYVYQYNDQGLPVQMQSGPWIVTYQYRKYK